MHDECVLQDRDATVHHDADIDVVAHGAGIEAEGPNRNDRGREQPTLRPSQVEQFRDAPVEVDIDKDEQAVGDSDREEIGNPPAKRKEFKTCSVGSIAVDDLLYAAEAGSAAMNQQHVQAKAGINGSRDVNGSKVNH